MTDVSAFQIGTYGLGIAESANIQAQARQLAPYALGMYPSEFAYSMQVPALVLGAAETSNTEHDINAMQLGVYALVRGYADKENLRAWQFPQDDHLFYVLQLGNGNGTLVKDMLTEQWAVWKSPGFDFWRGADGLDWEGMNVCCDVISGKLWRIDPDGRLDYEDTPIESVVTGMATVRMRRNVSCFAAELAASDIAAADGVSIKLETSDDDELTWVNHGELTENFRWFGLGLMSAPGRIFRVTDTGLARRIDGLDAELS